MRSIGMPLVAVALAVVVALLSLFHARSACLTGRARWLAGPRFRLVVLTAVAGALLADVLQSLAAIQGAEALSDGMNGAKNVCGPGKVDLGGGVCQLEGLAGAAGGAAAGGAASGKDDKYGGYKDAPAPPPPTRPYAHEGPPVEYIGGEHDPAFREARDKYAYEHRDTTPSTPPSAYEQGSKTFRDAILTGGGKANR